MGWLAGNSWSGIPSRRVTHTVPKNTSKIHQKPSAILLRSLEPQVQGQTLLAVPTKP